ncbi:MAG: F0F1 ATP synthase subunit A [Chloroflexi bacterium]|nr:F0F1 ATP synthase subunit A [Chloroflexota bacterium]
MPKKRLLGLPFPVLLGILLLVFGLFILGLISGTIGSSLFPNLNIPDQFKPPLLKLSLPAEVVFNIGPIPITNSIIGSWITVIVLVLISFIVKRRMKKVPGRLQGIFEFLLGYLYNLCRDIAGEKRGRQFFPIIATIFLFVSFNAWLGLFPGYGAFTIVNPEGHTVPLIRAANTDINMPLAIAIASFFSVWYFGFKNIGAGYITKFFNGGLFLRSFGTVFKGKVKEGFSGVILGFINIFVGILELLSEFIRILSFTFRLFGNMLAGEILISVIMFVIPFVFAIPFYGLEMLVGFVQALIFSSLTLVFATIATSHGEE